MDWGLLGGEKLGSERRIRTLGLGAAVRAFNNLAVPGLGGVWFGRQMVLALLGIHLAERVRSDGGQPVSNIAAANGIEALAVWYAYKRNGWERHERLPGFRKLGRRRGERDPSFKVAASRTYYVSQPMRIGTLDPLAALGLVDAPSRRFNAYTSTERGRALLNAVCPGAMASLTSWIRGGSLPYFYNTIIDDLDPTRPIPAAAREILREAIISGRESDRERRRAALDWVDSLRAGSEGGLTSLGCFRFPGWST